MKIIKGILSAFLIIIVLFLLVAFFLPSEYSVERSIEVNKSPEIVYSVLTNFNEFKKWNPWLAKEPSAETETYGYPGLAGHKWRWNGNEIGSGEITIEELNPYTDITCKIKFEKPEKGEALILWTCYPLKEGTRVTWRMTGEADYPIGRYVGLFMDGLIGPDFEVGLGNFKDLVEEKRKVPVVIE